MLHLLKGENLIILWYEHLTKINYRQATTLFPPSSMFLASISPTMHCILLFMNEVVTSFIIMLADYRVMVST